MTHSPKDQTLVRLQARGGTHAAIAWGLCFPDDGFSEFFGNDALRFRLAQALAAWDDPSAADLSGNLESAWTLATTTDMDELQSAHRRLFGHVVRGKCPPYELEYGRREILQQASELADLAGFYAAFGMQLNDDAHERPDHVCAECEFMSVLAAKEAHALEKKDDEARTVIVDAGRSFLADHLGLWLPAMARRLRDADPDGFYGAMGRLAGSLIELECRLKEVPCGPQLLELRTVDPNSDGTIQCGSEESCPGGENESLIQIGIDRGDG